MTQDCPISPENYTQVYEKSNCFRVRDTGQLYDAQRRLFPTIL